MCIKQSKQKRPCKGNEGKKKAFNGFKETRILSELRQLAQCYACFTDCIREGIIEAGDFNGDALLERECEEIERLLTSGGHGLFRLIDLCERSIYGMNNKTGGR